MAISKIPSAGFQDNVKFRNLFINGDMSIAQRGTSATGLGNADNGYHTCDRWKFTEVGTATAEFTQTQSTDVPTGQGFATSLKMDCTTAQGSLGANEIFRIQQHIEGQNLQYLKKGTANAESLTLSFWVKSNKTGTYTIYFFDNDNTRLNSKSYTINSADTWEKKTITIVGDTTGAFANDNNLSLLVSFQLLAGTDYTSGTLQDWGTNVSANFAPGQVNLADSTSNEWYVTGVQLEAGTSASDFEFLPHDVNLERCMRYYQVYLNGNDNGLGMGSCHTTTNAYTVLQLLKTMRTTPSIDQVSGTNYYILFNNGVSDAFDSFALATNQSTNTTVRLNNADTIGVTKGHAGWFESNNASSFLAFDAEL